MASSYIDLPLASSGGITSINGNTTPAQVIAAGTNITVVSAAGTTTISSTASGGLTWNSVGANTNVAASNGYFVNSGTGAWTMTLPAPSNGDTITIVDSGNNANVNNITIAPHAGEKINFVAASYIFLAKGGSITLVSDGTDWYFI